MIASQVIGRPLRTSTEEAKPKLRVRRFVSNFILAVGMVVLVPRWWVTVALGTVSPWFVRGCLVLSDAFVITGVVTWWGASRQLGRYWVNGVVIQEGQPLLTTGWYRVCKHPVYLGELVTSSGAVLAIGGPISLLVYLAAATVNVWPRMREEHHLLLHTFGHEYERYTNLMGWHSLIPVPSVWMRCLLTTWRPRENNGRRVTPSL